MTAAKKARKPRPFRLTPPEPLENQVQKQIGDYLNWCREVKFWWRQNVGSGRLERPDGTLTQYMVFAFEGCPDIVGHLCDGTALYIETKRPSVKRGRVAQEAFIAAAQQAGCVALFARDYSDVKKALDIHFGRITP